MNVLITGGTGFVGSGVIRMMLAAGYHVKALTRASSAPALPEHPWCSPVVGDPLDLASVIDSLDRCAAVVHLVGIRRKQIQSTGSSYADIDVGSVRVMAKAMRLCGIKRIVLLSAGAIGKSEYVRCKAQAEKIVIDAELEWTILRPAFIIGPGQQWPRLIGPILRGLGHLPGHIGDMARRAGNVTRRQLAASILWSLGSTESIGQTLDVPAIRAKQPPLESSFDSWN